MRSTTSCFLTYSAEAAAAIEQLSCARWQGRVAAATAGAADILGLARHVSLGDRIMLHGRRHAATVAEIVSLRGDVAHAMTFAAVSGIGVGTPTTAPMHAALTGLAVSDAWIGRVLDPLGRPLDARARPQGGASLCPVRAAPADATRRARLGPRVSLGVRALDLFATCRQGQRIGLFAGSGIGKSTLLAMLARNVACDVAVIALVGERGREVREFIEDDLAPSGLERSVVVVATSDASPLMRREAAYAAITVAEHYRDSGRNVLFLMDSVTRFCQALREIALSAGEPPASRGYPPTVFAELPRFLERAGPGPDAGDRSGRMTAFFTVLVDGDDFNEPICDAVRGILDGHIILSRQLAGQGHYPAIDILHSVSRLVSAIATPDQREAGRKIRAALAAYRDAEDLIQLGAYVSGSNPALDASIRLRPELQDFLCQDHLLHCPINETLSRLKELSARLDGAGPSGNKAPAVRPPGKA